MEDAIRSQISSQLDVVESLKNAVTSGKDPVAALKASCEKTTELYPECASLGDLLRKTEGLETQMNEMFGEGGAGIFGAALEEVNGMATGIMGKSEGALGSLNGITGFVGDAKLQDVFKMFDEFKSFVAIIQKLVEGGADKLGAGPACLLTCYADSVKGKLTSYQGEVNTLVGGLVDKAKMVVVDQLVTDAAQLPEKLTAVVAEMASLPEKIKNIVALVLEEPDTDTSALIQEIKDVFSLEEVFAALAKLRDDASEIVTQIKLSVQRMAAFVAAAPGKIEDCFDPPCPPLFVCFGRPSGEVEIRNGLDTVAALVGGGLEPVVAAMTSLVGALEAINPDELKAAMDQFVDTGVHTLQKVLKVTAIFGKLKDELEEVMALVEGSADQTEASLKAVVDNCDGVSAACGSLVESTEKTLPLCESTLKAFTDIDEVALLQVSGEFSTQQQEYSSQGLKEAADPLTTAVTAMAPADKIQNTIAAVVTFLADVPVKLGEATAEMEVPPAKAVMDSAASIQALPGLSELPDAFSKLKEALDTLSTGVNALEDTCVKPLDQISTQMGTAAEVTADAAEVIKKAKLLAENPVAGVADAISAAGVDLGGLAGGMF
eukprot:TRINITY_DN3200_c0_g1_i1.p1 TRINITY_DN3200_c0_g1~~TRINITY_DN3200_c0_g1_i1.p1  ORF type:complete len:604 (-),score=226.60 TRINITY_DN3200_c0_g1_i1:248-2059(-)